MDNNILMASDILLKKKGRIILSLPQIHVCVGDILALIGPNGAGKTSLLNVLSFLHTPEKGEIYFKGEKVGKDISALEYKRKIAMVFQEPLLLNTTVFNNIALGLKIRKIKKEKIKHIVNILLEKLNISSIKDNNSKTLSGGESQRVSLARALACDPEILFLDEPFTYLDTQTKNSLINDLSSILKETKTTVIFATHNREEALSLSTKIAVINEGKIVQLGKTEEVLNNPINEFVASFIGMETVLKGRVTRKLGSSFFVNIEGQEIEAIGEVNIGETVILGIRPEIVVISKTFSKDLSSMRNSFFCTVKKIVATGSYYKVYLECPFLLIANITKDALEILSLNVGDKVRASFKATAIHVISKRI